MKKENFFNRSELNIGDATGLTISDMIRKDLVTDAEVSKFKKQFLQFRVATAKKNVRKKSTRFHDCKTCKMSGSKPL